MNRLLKNIETGQNKTARTGNYALSYHSTLDANVDLFGSIGSMRARSDREVISAFNKAFGEDKLKALKIMFWACDIRGGAGERKVVRTILSYLAKNHTNTIRKNIDLIPEYGRWDDLYTFVGTPLEQEALALMRVKFYEDLENAQADKPVSLLGKWLKSENASAKETKQLATKTRLAVGLSSKDYRKALSLLRKKIKIVEAQLCAKEWDRIIYDQVPSRASLIYRNAFRKHDENRYQSFLGDVEKGEKTIKTSTLYPYDIIRKILSESCWRVSVNTDQTMALQWENLPNYVEPFNGLVVCDTSGSMYSSGSYGGSNKEVRPIDVAISLAMYIGERNEGDWKDRFITFSSNPKLQSIKGSNIFEKVGNLAKAEWGGSTNIQGVFDLVLKTAKANGLSQDDMPRMLMVVSDMQFDQCAQNRSATNFESIEKKYAAAGYERPQLVFWVVNSYEKDKPITVDENGTCLVSGASPAILKSVLRQEVLTPVDVMNATIEAERYEAVTV